MRVTSKMNRTNRKNEDDLQNKDDLQKRTTSKIKANYTLLIMMIIVHKIILYKIYIIYVKP